jgi:Putative zinc-finger
MTTLRCSQLREMAPDVALGLLTGAERAAALGHLESCAGCRAEVAALASVADEVLLTAPAATPPDGFDRRVLAALAEARATGAPATGGVVATTATPPQRRPGRRHTGGPRRGARHGRPTRVAIGATMAAAAAALVLVAVLVARGDRSGPDETVQMLTSVGEVVGTATVHHSEPATLSVDLPEYPDNARSGVTYWLAIELDDGSRRMTQLDTDDSYWRVPLANADEVATVSVLDQRGYVWCLAEFPA